MKKTIIFIFFFLAACNTEEKKKEFSENNSPAMENKLVSNRDTIPERNNPLALDLTKHQLFIDTTRTSQFYKEIEDWKLENSEIEFETKNKKLATTNFPSLFITLNKFDGEFLLYNRCDGMDPRYEIRKNHLIIDGSLEKTEWRIMDVEEIEPDTIKLKFNKESDEMKAFATLSKTEQHNVYKLRFKNKHSDFTSFVTPVKSLHDFNMLVNHCPREKVLEFNNIE